MAFSNSTDQTPAGGSQNSAAGKLFAWAKSLGTKGSASEDLVHQRVEQFLQREPCVDAACLDDIKSSGLAQEYPKFLDAFQERLRGLKEAVDSQDLGTTTQLIHKMIGASSMLGASALCKYVETLEVEIQESQTWPAEAFWMETVERLFLDTRAEIERQLGL